MTDYLDRTANGTRRHRYIVQVWASRLDYSHNASASIVVRVLADSAQEAAAKGCGRASVSVGAELANVYRDTAAAEFCGAFSYSVAAGVREVQS
jgi:hypothetical protein